MAKDKSSTKSKDDRRMTASDRSAKRIKTYLMYALAMLAASCIALPLLFRIVNIINPPLYTEYSNPTPSELHDIFFSGRPQLIFCTNRTGTDIPRIVKRVADAAEELTTNAFATVDEQEQQDSLELTTTEKERAYKEGIIHSRMQPLQVGTLDCDAPLPSGKSVIERFGLTLPSLIMPGGAAPTREQAQQFHILAPLPPVFLVANGERPVWIPNDLFAKPDHQVPHFIVQHSIQRASPKTTIFTTEKQFHARCTSKKSCLVILHSGASNLVQDKTSMSIRSIQKKFPAITVGTIDVKKHTLDLQKNLGKNEDTEQSKWPRMLYFRRQANKEGEAGSSKTTSTKDKSAAAASTLYVKSYKGSWNPSEVTDWIEGLTDHPSYSSNGSLLAPPSGEKPKTSGMAVLKRAPILNYGQDNFKRPPSQKKKQKDAAKKQEQKKEAQKPASTKDQKQSAAEREREEREAREREDRRREQMEAEAAENFVQAAEGEEEEGEFQQGEEESEDGEVVSLDEEEDRDL